MLVITSELYAELILFPAPIQAGSVLMHSPCMDCTPWRAASRYLWEEMKSWDLTFSGTEVPPAKWRLAWNVPYPVTTTGLPGASVEVGTGCQQLSTSRGIRLPAGELLLGKNVVWKSCSALMKIKRRFTSVRGGCRSRQEATCFEAAENSKLSSWSGHQRSNVPSAQLGRNSIPWLMLFLPYT